MRVIVKQLLCWVLVCAILGLWGCGGSSSTSETPNTAPQATLTSPSSGTFTAGNAITFSGSGTDAEDGTLSGASLVWASNVDGQIGTGTALTSTSLSVGNHTITLTVTDNKGATGSATVDIAIVANTAPVVTLSSPQSGTFESGSAITFNGIVTDSEDGPLTGSSLVWTSNIDGQIGTGAYFVGSSLSVGSHTITLTATDSNGATGTATVDVTVAAHQNASPTATISSPAANTTFPFGDAVTFSGSGTDTEDGTLSGASLVWTSSRDGQIGTGTSFSHSSLSPGNHTITLTVTDSEGATAQATVSIVISNTAPQATITAPQQSGSYTSGAAVTFSGSGTDTEDGTLSGNALVWTSSVDGQIGTGTSFDVSTLTLGSHTITLTATDNSGATGTATVDITIVEANPENMAPTAAITAPASGSFISGATITFSGSGTDAEDGTLSGNALVWTSSTDGQIGTGTSFDVSTLSLGNHTLTLTARDSNGATGTATVDITIVEPNPENTAPTATITAPEDGMSYSYGTAITFSGTGTDTEDGTLSDVSLVWTSDIDGQLGTGASLDVSSLSIGDHTITLTVTDSEAATAQTSVSITISNTAPTATITSPASSTYIEGDAITFSGSGTDTEDGTLGDEALVWTSSLDNQIGTGTTFDSTTLSVGSHTITLTVTDSAGATGTATVDITVDEKLPDEYSNTLGMNFKRIPAGTFEMGSAADDPNHNDNETQHDVTLTSGFYMMATEVTQKQWSDVMGSNPAYFESCGNDCPVEDISWNDIQTYIIELNKRGEGTYRLPTEAEWEYAARAGTTTEFNTGACLSTDQADYNGNYPLDGCPSGDYLKKPVAVGSYSANAWGLYDMHGNVKEWCQDWYDANYYATNDALTDPAGPESGSQRVLRGGSWAEAASFCRSASRSKNNPAYGNNNSGFRLIVDPFQNAPQATIISPISKTYIAGDTITFSGTGTDPEDGALSGAALVWTDEEGDQIGTGTAFSSTTLAVGEHTITLTVTDQDGASDTDTVSITIEEPIAGDYVNDLGMGFTLIPSGTFTMGSPSNEPGRSEEETQHQVTISNDFYIMTTEVTQKQWTDVMGSNPAYFESCGEDCPVEDISWTEIQTFIEEMNKRGDDKVYRLPTEAEWEYAARGQTTTAFNTGDCLSTSEADYNGSYPQTGCTVGQYRKKPLPVGSLSANYWGLYDMHGNVKEWCQDWYAEDYYATSPTIDPDGPSSGTNRVLRGGSWAEAAAYCRSAFRNSSNPAYKNNTSGFRLAISTTQSTNTYLEATITSPTNGTTYGYGDTITFSATATANDGSTLSSGSYVWTLEEDDQTIGTAASFSTTSLAIGTHTVTLTVTDNDGRMGKATVDVTITEAIPEEITNSLSMTFKRIQAGTFTMGSPTDEPGHRSNETQHDVTLTSDFYMMTTEVTQKQWTDVMGSNPSTYSSCGDDCPVGDVSWNDVQAFITAMNKLGDNGTYRLPTEAEWEYAARAGTTTAFNSGDCLSTDDDANYNGNDPQEGCDTGTHLNGPVAVGSFLPNAWGLYDMHGNAREYCQDWYGDYPTDSVTDPSGSTSGSSRVLRGGYWLSGAQDCRSAARDNTIDQDSKYNYDGFRLVFDRNQ